MTNPKYISTPVGSMIAILPLHSYRPDGTEEHTIFALGIRAPAGELEILYRVAGGYWDALPPDDTDDVVWGHDFLSAVLVAATAAESRFDIYMGEAEFVGGENTYATAQHVIKWAMEKLAPDREREAYEAEQRANEAAIALMESEMASEMVS